MSGAAPIQRRERNDEEGEYDETEESRSVNGLIYDKVYEAAEKFAGTYVGQYATGKVDRILKLIEDTAKWSLPQSSQEKSDSSAPLERPLPWIPFIAMILMLRMVRISLSVGGLFIGNSPLVPGDVVYFIQTRRRKLRAIRIVGLREIRRKEQVRGQKSGGIVAKLRSLLSVVVCRPGQGREIPTSSTSNQNNQEGSSNTGGSEIDPLAVLNHFLNNDVVVRTHYGAHPLLTTNTSKGEKDVPSSKRQRPEEEDGSDHDLTLDQIIDKYGEADSDNDSDFIPPDDALNDDDTSSQSTSSATSDDDEDEDTEVQQHKEDVNPESDAHMTNGNGESQDSSSSNENQAADNSVVIKENGEHFSKSSRKPVPLPKPHREEPMPAPIQEIKQEPVDSDDDTSSSQQVQQDPAELKRSSDQQQNQQQQSVVARNEDKVYVNNDEPKDDVERTTIKKVNGNNHPPVIDHQSGSPNVSEGGFGFQPTSILKNANAVYLEKRGPAVAYTDDDHPSRAERTTESHATSRPINTSHQPARGSSHHSTRPNKNRFRGKRR